MHAVAAHRECCGRLTEGTRTLSGVCGTPRDGPYVAVELDLELATGRIAGSRYGSNGCPSARQAARAVGEFAIGRTLEQLARLEAGDLTILAGPLREGQGHYYDKAIAALEAALASANGPTLAQGKQDND